VDNPILFGLLTIIFAFMPYVGAVVVWLPIVLLMLLNGIITGYNPDIVSAMLLSIYSIIIVSSIDNILKPKIIGDRGKIHPVVVLVGVLGGLVIMGPIGVVTGPLVLSLTFTFFEIYQEEIRESK
jgi:predicted PurR-regulated permease PerM